MASSHYDNPFYFDFRNGLTSKNKIACQRWPPKATQTRSSRFFKVSEFFNVQLNLICGRFNLISRWVQQVGMGELLTP